MLVKRQKDQPEAPLAQQPLDSVATVSRRHRRGLDGADLRIGDVRFVIGFLLPILRRQIEPGIEHQSRSPSTVRPDFLLARRQA
jgi:hypothetical protein